MHKTIQFMVTIEFFYEISLHVNCNKECCLCREHELGSVKNAGSKKLNAKMFSICIYLCRISRKYKSTYTGELPGKRCGSNDCDENDLLALCVFFFPAKYILVLYSCQN